MGLRAINADVTICRSTQCDKTSPYDIARCCKDPVNAGIAKEHGEKEDGGPAPLPPAPSPPAPSPPAPSPATVVRNQDGAVDETVVKVDGEVQLEESEEVAGA